MGTPRARRLSLNETQQIVPDHDYPSTADNLLGFGRDSDEPCFTLEAVAVGGIDPSQLIDDPDDKEGWTKVFAIREAIHDGRALPPVYVLHHPEGAHPYCLFEGRHRFNAARAENTATVSAWVAHIDCCDDAQEVSND